MKKIIFCILLFNLFSCSSHEDPLRHEKSRQNIERSQQSSSSILNELDN